MKDYKYKINPERKSDIRTICEVHRELHRRLTDFNWIGPEDHQVHPQIFDLIAEAYDMAKRMSKKLEEYSSKRGHDFAREYMDD